MEPTQVEPMVIPTVVETSGSNPKDITIMETLVVKYFEPDHGESKDSMDSEFVDNTQKALEVGRIGKKSIPEVVRKYVEFLKTSWANMVDVEENEALTQKDSEATTRMMVSSWLHQNPKRNTRGKQPQRNQL